MEQAILKATDSFSTDYLIALVTVRDLDLPFCAFGGEDCSNVADCQFYFELHGERVLRSACFCCLMPAVYHEVGKGQKIIVEVRDSE